MRCFRRFALPGLGLFLAVAAAFAQPAVRIYSPTNGAVFLQPTNVPLHLRVEVGVDNSPYNSLVEIFDGTNFIGSFVYIRSYFINWSNVAFGVHTLSAVLHPVGGSPVRSSNVTFRVEYGGYALVAPGAAWRYLDGGADPGPDWHATNTDTSAWKTGLAQFGFGDGDEATWVDWRNPTNGQVFPAYYFLHAFTVPDPLAHSNLVMRLQRDDGAIVHLNGEELFRDNMPAGPVNPLTYALQADPYDGLLWIPYWLAPGRLQPGFNLFAVEIHNCCPQNEDISFDFALIADVPEQPALAIQRAGANALVSWPRAFAGFRLESAPTPAAGGAAWQRVTNGLGASPTSFLHTNRMDAGQQFFRLKIE
jgi:hypothetical protein